MLLDNAATTNFITASCANKLKLTKRKANVPIKGLGESNVGCAKNSTEITFCPHFDVNKQFTMEALIVPEISNKLPMSRIMRQPR